MSLADDVKIELLVLSLKNTFEFYPYWCPFFFLKHPESGNCGIKVNKNVLMTK